MPYMCYMCAARTTAKSMHIGPPYSSWQVSLVTTASLSTSFARASLAACMHMHTQIDLSTLEARDLAEITKRIANEKGYKIKSDGPDPMKYVMNANTDAV